MKSAKPCASLIRSAENLKNAIIFCNRKREVAQLHRSLLRHKFNAVALHGDMDQSARTAALEAFRKGEAKLLIASDVAARGLDIPEVSHVFNFDVPHHSDDYVHRIGRTGRAGRAGTAISIVAPIDKKSVASIERLIGQTIPWMGEPAPAADSEEIAAAEGERSRRNGRGRGRERGQEATAIGTAAGPPSREQERQGRPERQDVRSAKSVLSGKNATTANRCAPATSRARARSVHNRRTKPTSATCPAFLLRPVPIKA